MLKEIIAEKANIFRVMILILCFIFTITVVPINAETSFVNNNNSGIDNNIIVARNALGDNYADCKCYDCIAEEINSLEQIGAISKNSIINAKEEVSNKSASVVYTVDYEGIINTVRMLETNENMSIVEFKQGNIINIVKILSNGHVYVDGNLVEYGDLNNLSNTPITVADSSTWYQNSPPYGSQSDYTYNVNSSQNSNVSLTKKISKYTVGALATVISVLLPGSGLATHIASAIYNYFVDNDPNTQGLSYKLITYNHKNYHNSYISPINKYVTMYKYTWYSKTSYHGSSKKVFQYRCKEIY